MIEILQIIYRAKSFSKKNEENKSIDTLYSAYLAWHISMSIKKVIRLAFLFSYSSLITAPFIN